MTTDEQDGPRLPTDEEENRFWTLLDQARSRAGTGTTEGLLEALTELCDGMSSRELTDLDRVVERKLYDADRADIHAVTDGSDDGFLYARGLIVASGREAYYGILADPSLAEPDGELEEMCYFFAHLHNEKYGSWPKTGSGISRESCSNAAGWRSA
jgi:hypothetical protein